LVIRPQVFSSEIALVICHTGTGQWHADNWRAKAGEYRKMEVLTPKAMRRSTRIRVEIPITVTSLDRVRPFAERCVAVVVSGQGCGFRSSRALQIETPIFLSDLPGGGSVTARVASCLPLGNDGKSFLIGVALYTHGNVWGIADPPEDWGTMIQSATAAGAAAHGEPAARKPAISGNKNWPYNRFADGTEAHPREK
jgi:hypothetical protein